MRPDPLQQMSLSRDEIVGVRKSAAEAVAYLSRFASIEPLPIVPNPIRYSSTQRDVRARVGFRVLSPLGSKY